MEYYGVLVFHGGVLCESVRVEIGWSTMKYFFPWLGVLRVCEGSKWVAGVQWSIYFLWRICEGGKWVNGVQWSTLERV